MAAHMIFRTGYLTIGRFGSAPVRVHWTTPVGAFVLTGMTYVPGAWLGFLILVLVHELGHAAIARAYGCRVVSIDVNGLGGACTWQGNVSEQARASIAWGGVLAQAILLFTTPLWASHIPPAGPPFLSQVVYAFTGTNVLLMLLNLIPMQPLDGAEAWRILRFGGLLRAGRERILRARLSTVRRQLDTLEKNPRPGASGKGAKVIPIRRPPPDRSTLS
jgi:Zn-dependent protease